MCIRMLLKCTLLGGYEHGKVRPVPRIQRILFKYFTWKPIEQGALAQWIRAGNQHIVFIAIKEYIAFAVNMVPGLEAVLEATYPWKTFYSCVVAHADAVRTAMNKCEHDDIFMSVRSSITTLRGMKCEAVPPSWFNVVTEFIAIIRNMPVKEGQEVIPHMRQDIYDRLRRAHGLSAIECARAMGLPACVLDIVCRAYRDAGWKCKGRANARTVFQSLTAHHQYIVHEFMQAWAIDLSVRTHALPEHIARAQNTTIQNKKCLTDVYICCSCKQIRAFIVDTNTASKNAWACGNSKVMLDDESWQLYCARKVEKNTNGTRPMTASRNGKLSHWKYHCSNMCKESRLIRLDISGKILQFYSLMYALCPGCACLTVIRHTRFLNNTFTCIHCQYKHKQNNASACDHCYEPCRRPTIVQCDTGTVRLCDRCTLAWMRRSDITAQLNINQLHRAINEKWTANRARVQAQ